jgi:hypothetical protein
MSSCILTQAERLELLVKRCDDNTVVLPHVVACFTTSPMKPIPPPELSNWMGWAGAEQRLGLITYLPSGSSVMSSWSMTPAGAKAFAVEYKKALAQNLEHRVYAVPPKTHIKAHIQKQLAFIKEKMKAKMAEKKALTA